MEVHYRVHKSPSRQCVTFRNKLSFYGDETLDPRPAIGKIIFHVFDNIRQIDSSADISPFQHIKVLDIKYYVCMYVRICF